MEVVPVAEVFAMKGECGVGECRRREKKKMLGLTVRPSRRRLRPTTVFALGHLASVVFNAAPIIRPAVLEEIM